MTFKNREKAHPGTCEFRPAHIPEPVLLKHGDVTKPLNPVDKPALSM
jgi:hypothetical protein